MITQCSIAYYCHDMTQIVYITQQTRKNANNYITPEVTEESAHEETDNILPSPN